MIITVGGTVSSGKSVVARHLAEKLGYEYLSPGKIMRDMAAEKGMGILEFSEYAEAHPEVDGEIDERQKKLAKGEIVVDGRLSAHILDADYRIWLTAPIEERVKRIMGRESEFECEDLARSAIQEREDSERKRYRDFYGIELDDLSIYDLVLNTGNYGITDMKEVVLFTVEKSGN